MTLIALGVVGILSIQIFFDVIARPTIRRLGFRSVARRKGEATLVVVGSMLATALIVASLLIGESFGSSIRSIAVSAYGPVDQVFVSQDAESAANKLSAELEATGSPIDGALATRTLEVALTNADGITEPGLELAELDLAAAKAFGDDPEATGLGSLKNELGNNKLVVDSKTADSLSLEVGEQVQIFFDVEPTSFEVAALVPPKGLTGATQLIVDPGTIEASSTQAFEISEAAVLISNVGDVFSGAARSDEASSFIKSTLDDPSLQISPVKQWLLDDAESEAAEMTELFGTIGGFSVAAGVLLLINLFVMLASERKVELGTLRALGITKSQLRRAFSLEGLIYGCLSVVLGLLVGIGVAAAVMELVGGSFSPDSQLEVVLSVPLTALISGAAFGLAISQLTVTLTSMRLVRLNPARALVDAADPKQPIGKRMQLLLSAVGAFVGLGLFVLAGDEPVVAMVAPVIVAIGLIIPFSMFLGRRIAVVAACLAGIIWAAGVFGFMEETMEDPEIPLFLVQGLLLVGLGATIAGSLNSALRSVVSIISKSYSTKLGLAYPLARPVRSALLISMYALVIFTLTFMSIMNGIFTNNVPKMAYKAGGDYELVVDSNPAAPIPVSELTASSGIIGAAEVRRTVVLREDPEDPSESRKMLATVIDESFASVALGPPTMSRIDDFASDQLMWDAVARSDNLAVVPAYFDLEPGEVFKINDAEGQRRSATVAGVTENSWLIGGGSYIGIRLADNVSIVETLAARHYLDLTPSASIQNIEQTVEREFAKNGASADSIIDLAKEDTAEDEVFINILRSYLGLGLLIGIAGLGVVLIRAVRERRRQLGMMRTVGVKSSVTRNSFLVEAGFVGLQGVLLGVGLGVLSSWQIFTQSNAFEPDLEFVLPYFDLLALGAIAIFASLIAGAFPAFRASRTLPAVALRIAS